jgi:glutamyl-tRNA synthetase
VDALAALPDWNHDACDKALRDVAAAAQVKAGLLINAARVAMVGQAVAPPLFDSMVAIGQAQVVARIRKAIPMLDPAAH